MKFEDYKQIVRGKRNNITLVLKVTNDCPLRCTYCYHFYKNKEDMSLEMPIELLKESIVKMCLPFKEVNIHVHGGEPLSLPNEKLEEIFKFISEYRDAVKDYQKVFPAVQTNLCFYDDEKKKLIEKYQIGLSTSFDGIYHDKTRNLDVEEGINKLNGIKEKGIINVVTKDMLGKFDEQMETFEKIKNSTVMSNAVFPYCCPSESRLHPGDYADYVIKRFEYQFNNNKDFSWDTLRYFNAVVYDGKGLDCFCSYCLNSIYTINPSGVIQGCDVRHEDIYYYGNIRDIEKYEDIFELEGYQKFEKATYEVINRCSNCEAFKYCRGGCFNRVVVDEETNCIARDAYCYDIKKLIAYYKEFFAKYDNDINKLPERLRHTRIMLDKECKDKQDFYSKGENK